jgi:ATP-binding cassette subfamily F protein uup
LFTQAANLLVLDEPTNDLDMETLEVLEQRLTDYNGTLIVVSHDREFLDNVVTSTIVFEENGVLREYVGGYSDWLRQGKALAEVDDPNIEARADVKRADSRDKQKPKKLTFNEQRELDRLPEEIDKLETRIDELLKKISASDFYSQEYEQTGPVLQEFAESQQALDLALERWSELEDLQQQYQQSRA